MLTRTDLAAEARRLCTKEAPGSLPGVRFEEGSLEGLPLETLEVEAGEGAALLHKAPGRYFTLTLPEHPGRGEGDFGRCVRAVAALIRRCLPLPESVGFARQISSARNYQIVASFSISCAVEWKMIHKLRQRKKLDFF